MAEIYADLRRAGVGADAWLRWTDARRHLLTTHPASPLDAHHRTAVDAVRYFDYDPSWHLVATVYPSEDTPEPDPSTLHEGPSTFTPIGSVTFERVGVGHRLGLFWLQGYGGGLFLPFGDTTNGHTTYGGGRYLLDGAKSADLGSPGPGRLLLDFNFAYHPSCLWGPGLALPTGPAVEPAGRGGRSRGADTARRGAAMTNRLASESSPYLQQHADNPVDWYPWGPEALERAVAEDRPILLSVGYSACHWCHVMAHESFEDPTIAAKMNASFVNVKVDREERPDIDALYMEAVQAMTGHGGWPMTVVMTPTGEPFFAGTYFPPAPRHGIAGVRRPARRHRRGLAGASGRDHRARRRGDRRPPAARRAVAGGGPPRSPAGGPGLPGP